MPTPNRITRFSGWLYWAVTVLAYCLPCIVIAAILRGWFDPASLIARFPLLPPGVFVSPLQGTLVAAVAVCSLLPLVGAFLAMRRLFSRYRRGEILTDACADDIRLTGQALIFVAAATVLVPMLQLLILSWNTPGGRILSIGIDGGALGFLLSGAMLTVIGWVMREAARAADENRGFV
jgi:amino acid transporter